ncbi:HD domain-containing protein [Marinigracilibium pacificum]|uniref:HD domain-containing protein n=1 Tax=Marinigracilibium pacificum TaxID=2729599 RepID=A0A848IY84_9BACT|nr:HD domain-containing protein [Marinigracilibium pacificum]NMM48596.1 HD domain-containing protein [Marinigracilibium pacificum]
MKHRTKIFNDPVYGFISVPYGLPLDTVDHPYFQRLRRIKQLGLAELVYPGALHTRFHHALGAYHLMGLALDQLRNKGHQISAEEFQATQMAILLHDIGHGPFSHALEYSLMPGIRHEEMSIQIMKRLNDQFDGAFNLTLDIFTNQYNRHFFHELVSSQLDIDRLDYLMRDSFFTGVSEGTVGSSRIIKMLEIYNDKLVVEEKGIYSIENFLNSRRLMYWQVYLHKTAVAAEKMLIQIIKRAKFLARTGTEVHCSPFLKPFLENNYTIEQIKNNPEILNNYCQLDDSDIWNAVKSWSRHEDKILSSLCRMIIDRRLFKIHLSSEPIDEDQIKQMTDKIQKHFDIAQHEAEYMIDNGSMTNSAYLPTNQPIYILTKKGKIEDVAIASDLPNIKAMSKIVKKYYLCWPKSLSL